MAAGAPAAFCRTSRRGFASPQSARSSWITGMAFRCPSFPITRLWFVGNYFLADVWTQTQRQFRQTVRRNFDNTVGLLTSSPISGHVRYSSSSWFQALIPLLDSSMLSVYSNVVHCHSLSSCCFPHLVTSARCRSSSIQSIHLLFCRHFFLFPVGFHWCTLLVSLSSFIRNSCPRHFNWLIDWLIFIKVHVTNVHAQTVMTRWQHQKKHSTMVMAIMVMVLFAPVWSCRTLLPVVSSVWSFPLWSCLYT